MIKRIDRDNQRGITFIEGFGVLLIVGFLLLMIVHTYDLHIPEKPKHRILEAHAKGMFFSVRDNLSDHEAGRVMLFLNAANTQVCYQTHSTAEDRDCATLYPDISETIMYEGIGDILNAIVMHHNIGREEVSPFNETPLINVTREPMPGHVTLYSPEGASILISAWDIDGSLLYNAIAVGDD